MRIYGNPLKSIQIYEINENQWKSAKIDENHENLVNADQYP